MNITKRFLAAFAALVFAYSIQAGDGSLTFSPTAFPDATVNESYVDKGPGIDFDSPEEWNKWYFDRSRGGGHPWEVVMGGNSTHVDFYVCHDKDNIEWKVRAGLMTEEQASRHPCGFYYALAGKHRQFETVNFYVALNNAGLPVYLYDAEEILARFDGSDYVGIVPHSVIPKYCEGMFPKEYGHVIDFMHVYKEEYEQFGDKIEWLPLEEAKLK